MNDDERVTYFGETDARNKRVRFGIKKKDRSRHMYIIGKTGMGKSNCLETLAIQDIQNGEGIAFIDPHGKSADLLLEYVPEHRIKDVIYFAPFDLDYPVSFNVLEDVGAERRHLVTNGLMSAFKKIWVDAWSARMEYILTNILLALLEYPGSTLMGVNRMLVDKEFRKTIVDNVSDPSVKAFWTEEYAKYTDKFAAEAAPAIQNKVGQFVANPLVRNIIGQTTSSFDIRQMMDEKKIFIVNLSKGRVGEANANLLGAMVITKIYLAAMSRADLSEDALKKSAQFYLYVDEFQSFANESFADILSEARKYKLNLTIAHQYIEQMTEEVRAAVFGNVGTMAVFRVGAFDADVFQKEFAPQFTAEDLVNLQQYQMYLKLMIDGVTSPPFSAKGMPPIPRPEKTFVQEIITASREQFARPRAEVEDAIRNWHIDKIQPVGGFAPTSTGNGQTQSGGGNGGDRGNSGGNDRDRGSFQGQRSSEGPRMDRPMDRGERGGAGNTSAPRSEFRPVGNDLGGDRGSAAGSGERRRDDRPAFGSMGSGERRDGRDGRPSTSGAGGDSRDRRDNRDGRDSAGRRVETSGDRDRERQLREAVSLNYLKDKKEDEAKAKNAEKDAKPQNLLALKEALLGILGEGEPVKAKVIDESIGEPTVIATPEKPVVKAEVPTQTLVAQAPITQESPRTEPSAEVAHTSRHAEKTIIQTMSEDEFVPLQNIVLPKQENIRNDTGPRPVPAHTQAPHTQNHSHHQGGERREHARDDRSRVNSNSHQHRDHGGDRSHRHDERSRPTIHQSHHEPRSEHRAESRTNTGESSRSTQNTQTAHNDRKEIDAESLAKILQS